MGIIVNVLFDLIHQESCIFLFLQHSRQTSTLGYMWEQCGLECGTRMS